MSLRTDVLHVHCAGVAAVRSPQGNLAGSDAHSPVQPVLSRWARSGSLARSQMDRRTVLAIILMIGVAIIPSILSPPPPRRDSGRGIADTARAVPGVAISPDSVTPREVPGLALPPPTFELTGGDSAVGDRMEPVVVTSDLYELKFSPVGARLTAAQLYQHRSYAPGDSANVNLIPEGSRFLAYSLVVGNDTLNLDEWVFQPSSDSIVVNTQGTTLELVAQRGGVQITLRYIFNPDRYLFDVHGEVGGMAGEAGLILVELGPRLGDTEIDSIGDFRTYAVVSKARSTEKLKFSSLDPGERRALNGPFEWVALKSKYFVAALLTISSGGPRLGGAVVTGGPRSGKIANRADIVVSLPAPGGRFSHSVYIGPQEYKRLARVGHDFQEVNPYGFRFIRVVIQPFAILIVKILIWLHETLNMAYGWVLVLFGVGVRLILWPLNQKAMRSSVAMQAIQPEIKALQQKYKPEPQRMQQELMKLYREHGVNPLGSCLPMLLPMPVLFALFFVFQNTIELRGVEFFWLPDLARPDPLYIIPIVMSASMYVLFKIGQIGVAPNPQAKMMLYLFPGMFLVIGINFPAGLNLYYTVSNIASLPQQWLIARERIRRLGKPKT